MTFVQLHWLKNSRGIGHHVTGKMFVRTATHMSKHKTKTPRQEVPSLPENDIKKQVSYQHSFTTFTDMIRKEKEDARNYLVIEDKSSSMQYHSPETLSQVLDSEVDQVYRFAVGPRSFSLVKLMDIQHFFNNASPSQNDLQFPVHSRILKLSKLPKGVKKVEMESRMLNLSLEKLASKKRIDILKSTDHERAIESLTEACSMTEFASKLRFVFLNHLEEIVCNGLFRHFELLPFGSSVNGFGDDFSDFDVVMTAKIDQETSSMPHLLFQSKPAVTERFQSQRLVDFIGDQLQFFTPGILSVTRIPKARVPIVKIYSDIFSLDCDIAFCSDTSVNMAKSLFHFCKMGPRVKQVATFVKVWAKSQDLTNPHPGPWFTNFELLLMVINFFQTRHGNAFILPPMKELNESQKGKGVFVENTPFIDILREFFEYLADFEYPHYGMSILQGKTIVKPHHDYFYIENPLEPDLNVCKNVSKTEVLRLVTCASNSLQIMSESNRSFRLIDLCSPFTKNTSHPFVTFHNKNRGSRGIKLDDYLIDDTKQ